MLEVPHRASRVDLFGDLAEAITEQPHETPLADRQEITLGAVAAHVVDYELEFGAGHVVSLTLKEYNTGRLQSRKTRKDKAKVRPAALSDDLFDR